jgi:hypothetical protein
MPVVCIRLRVAVAGGHTGASTAMRCLRSIPSPSRSPPRCLERRSTTHGGHDGTDLSADRQARRPEPHPGAVALHQDRRRPPRDLGRSSPHLRFGLAFCESSGRLVRRLSDLLRHRQPGPGHRQRSRRRAGHPRRRRRWFHRWRWKPTTTSPTASSSYGRSDTSCKTVRDAAGDDAVSSPGPRRGERLVLRCRSVAPIFAATSGGHPSAEGSSLATTDIRVAGDERKRPVSRRGDRPRALRTHREQGDRAQRVTSPGVGP